MYSSCDDCVFRSRVSPFGDLGVSAFCELSLVFVHLRPSSSSCAKASTLRPFFLDWKYFLLFSFLPNLLGWFIQSLCAYRQTLLVDLSRLELPTSRLSGVRSNHLSYRSKQ